MRDMFTSPDSFLFFSLCFLFAQWRFDVLYRVCWSREKYIQTTQTFVHDSSRFSSSSVHLLVPLFVWHNSQNTQPHRLCFFLKTHNSKRRCKRAHYRRVPIEIINSSSLSSTCGIPSHSGSLSRREANDIWINECTLHVQRRTLGLRAHIGDGDAQSPKFEHNINWFLWTTCARS